jgi:hypothetical protein
VPPLTLCPGPGAERAPNHHQLTEMIGRMIRDEEELAQVGLAVASWNSCEEIYAGVQGQLLQGLAILPGGRHALVPGVCGWWRDALRPVVVGPVELLIGWIPAELENVILGQTDVLQQLPGRVGEAVRCLSSKIRRKPGDDLLETNVRILPIQQVRDRGAQRISTGYDGTPPVEPAGPWARFE